MNLSPLKYIITYMSVAVLISASVFVFSYRNNLNLLSQTGGVRVEQARDRLLGQLTSFRQLPNYLAKHPRILAALNQSTPPNNTNEFLLNTSLITGADNIFVLNKAGTVIATSNYTEPDSYMGVNFANKPHVRAALNGRLGFYYALGSNDSGRDFYYARAISTPDNSRGGVVVVQIDVAALEFEWRVDEEVLAFFDNDGVAFVTNRQSLGLLRETSDPSIPVDTRRYPQRTLQPFFKHSKTRLFGHDIWNFKLTKELPATAMIISRFIPQIEMTARVFLDTKSAMVAARLQALLAATVLALIGLGMWALYHRRQRLADLLEIEEKANTKLEARVENRTEQLRTTQHQLIQAGKLTAMGQMSAGISHELNQPMAAIQNFAENGGKLIDRDRQDEARENFNLITQQITRMSRIIQSLRAFARKEKETIEPVDLQSVITESVNLTTARCEREGVTIIQTSQKTPIFVMGGQIRLQQVVINLIANAIDAMANQNDKKIEIGITQTLNKVRLTIRDNGPGFDDAARVFEPFYSTKDSGASKGLGLGLSISYGIIGSFGGDITCQNRTTGGAEFIVTLKPTTEKLAA